MRLRIVSGYDQTTGRPVIHPKCPNLPARTTRVLILNDDVAGGHRAAASAVSEALLQFPEAEVRTLNLHESSPGWRRWLKEKVYLKLRRKVKPAARLFFNLSMRPPGLMTKARWEIGARMNAWSMRRFEKRVLAQEPDIVLSVHMSTNALTRIWQAEGKLRAPVHCVVTDYVAHGIWASGHIKRYYVGSPGVREDLMRYGIPADRITVTGIPVSPAFARPETRAQEEVKKALGLDPKLPLVLILGGSLGFQPFEEILQAMEKSLKSVQIAVLCGRSQTARKRVEALIPALTLPVTARGFQSNMPDWYRAADVVVSTPGGLSTTEAVTAAKPLVLTSARAGMGELQAGRLQEAGLALHAESAEEVAALVRDLLQDETLRTKLRDAARAFRKPDAAMSIAKDLLKQGFNRLA